MHSCFDNCFDSCWISRWISRSCIPLTGRLAKLAGAVAFAIAATGCSPDATAPESAVRAPHKTTITALVWAPDWPDEMHRIAKEFMQLHPDIQVTVQFMIGNSVEENLKPKVASNSLPDLMSVNPNAYAAGLADQGLLADLGDTDEWRDMLDTLKSDWTSNTNRHFGISGGVAATLIYYNKEAFARAGILTVPRNFDEFLQVCAQLKKAGIVPIMWNGGFPNMLGNGPFSAGFANNIVAHHRDWKKSLSAGTLRLDTREGADIFAKIRLIPERGYVQENYMATNYDEGIKLFTEGKAAMAFHGTWASGRLMHGKGFTTGVFIPPWNAAGAKPVPVIGSETGFAIAETPDKKAALLFLKFLTGAGFSIAQNKRQNIPPAKSAPRGTVMNGEITDYLKHINRFAVTASPYYSFLPATTIELSHTLMQDVLFGKITPQQAARLLDASIRNAALNNNK